jgi:hypothetical protein
MVDFLNQIQWRFMQLKEVRQQKTGTLSTAAAETVFLTY